MSKTSGLGDYYLINGYDVSGDAASLDQIGGGPDLFDVTAIKELAHERLGTQRMGNQQVTTYFNPDNVNDAEHSALSTLPRTDVIGMFLHQAVVGNPGHVCNGKQLNYDQTRDATGGLTFKAQIQSNGFGGEWGVQLTSGIQTDVTASNNAFIDDGAATTFGAQGYLEVSSVVGTSATVTIQHSTDHVTWSTLMAFSAVLAGAKSQQRLAVSGTVNRYIRSITTGTFTVCKYAVVFNRNKVATSF